MDPTKQGHFRIDVGMAKPQWERFRRLSHHEKELLHVHFQEREKADIKEPGTGPQWASNPLVVPKKDGNVRFCIDMRGVNTKS